MGYAALVNANTRRVDFYGGGGRKRERARMCSKCNNREDGGYKTQSGGNAGIVQRDCGTTNTDRRYACIGVAVVQIDKESGAVSELLGKH